ncbi:nucleotidyl transferase [Silvibacterium dinghuense]|uniref:Nucleotidyl transferase n=1 Tax=Silvibacterium dinghuense TaxID=1560006 RepID=A0A4Q1SK83_9BACT|nr:nucleotidyl transferase [Silvibacterium dinghuense]
MWRLSECLPPVAILAGGLGTRMRPTTEWVPKVLLPVAGEPFLGHQLHLLAQRGVSDVVLCCGYLAEQIARYAGDGSDFGLHLHYSRDGASPLGTGGALRHALPMLGEEFFVLYGDSYLEVDLAEVYCAFVQSGLPALMTTLLNRSRWGANNVRMRGGLVTQYGCDSSPGMEYIDYGLSLFRAEVFASWPDDAAFPLTEVQSMLAAGKRMAAFEVSQRFYEIGSPSGLAETEAYLRSQPRRLRETTP